MCGFAGVIDVSRKSPAAGLEDAVGRMARTLSHRGPDDESVWVDPANRVALGFRRLAIVDLTECGRQPMHSASGRFTITFNGEIYNHRELRASLPESHRRSLKGHSDTEVLLALIEHRGLAYALQQSCGMFAIALWDAAERTLVLARDRMGEKPLYYGAHADVLLFGSELRALRAYPGFHEDIDPLAVSLFLQHGNVPAPLSIYRGVKKVPPGCTVRVRLGPNESLRVDPPESYWSLEDQFALGESGPLTGSHESHVDGLQDLLREVISGQLLADVPVGAFLSGGIDSSLVVSVMQELSTRPVRTFSIGFESREYDESPYADRVARHLKTDHTTLVVSSDQARDSIPEVTSIFDEPFADSSAIPTYLVSRLARQGVTVSLSGDGGDELFGGYPWYQATPGLWRRMCWCPAAIRALVGYGLTRFSGPGSQVGHSASQAGSAGESRWRRKARRLGAVLSRVRSVDELHHDLRSLWEARPPVQYPRCFRNGPARPIGHASALSDPRSRLMCRDALTYLPDDILVKVDRATMAVSLESRAPFLDHRVVELACRIPLDSRMGSGKRILKSLLKRYVPPAMTERPKMGFAVPLDQWLRDPLREWAESLICEESLDRLGLLDSQSIRNAWLGHLAGQDRSQDLWPVLMLQSWLEGSGRSAGARHGQRQAGACKSAAGA